MAEDGTISPRSPVPGPRSPVPAVAFGHVPPIADARRQYVELFGSPLVMNTYLKIAVLALSLLPANHSALLRATLKPQDGDALFFMESSLAEANIAHAQREHTIGGFLTGASDEIETQVRNVTLEELTDPPYRAVVEFDRVYYG